MISKEVVSPPESMEYVYGRTRIVKRVFDRFMQFGTDGCIFRPVDDESLEAIVYAYCKSRQEAVEFARDVWAFGKEFVSLGEDLREFVQTHETEKWPEPAAERCVCHAGKKCAYCMKKEGSV